MKKSIYTLIAIAALSVSTLAGSAQASTPQVMGGSNPRPQVMGGSNPRPQSAVATIYTAVLAYFGF
jgi:hypothetical protein